MQEYFNEPLTDEELVELVTPKDFTFTHASGLEVRFDFSVDCTTGTNDRVTGAEFIATARMAFLTITVRVDVWGMDEEGTPAGGHFHVEWNSIIFTSKDYSSMEAMEMDMRIAAGMACRHLFAEVELNESLTEKFAK